jgi:hypothetical protein
MPKALQKEEIIKLFLGKLHQIHLEKKCSEKSEMKNSFLKYNKKIQKKRKSLQENIAVMYASACLFLNTKIPGNE